MVVRHIFVLLGDVSVKIEKYTYLEKIKVKKSITNIAMKLLIIFIAITSVQTISATKTWNGSAGTNWNTTSNWTPSGVPASGDDVIIPSSLTNYPNIIAGQSFTVKTVNINSGGILNISGGTLSVTGTTSVSGTFTQTSGTFSGSTFNISSSGIVNFSGTTFTTNDDKITIDGGTFNHTGGTVSTKDMELKNGATYYQTNGEFQISHDLKSPAGTTFNQVGGTIRFTGAAGSGAVYTGVVQFYNLIVDPGATYNMNTTSDTIRVAGNFTNNNSSLKCDVGTLILNGASSQTFYSASSNNVAANVIVSCPNVTLLSDLRVKTSFSTRSGGHVNKNGFKIYQNGVEYTGPTPVELVSFNAEVKNNIVHLNWKTATEVNNYGFEIERSLDNEVWSKIGFVAGHGNSNSPKEYYFEDSKLSNNSYQYRLRQVDNDGSFAYSNIVKVNIDQLPNNFTLNQNYPNPFNPSTKISWQSPVSSRQTLKVYDIIGNEVATLVDEFREAGNYEIDFNASQLTSGVYVYKITAGNFSDTKKMILSK
jgi:hypothetical protein